MMIDIYANDLTFCPVCEYYLFDRLNEESGRSRPWFWLEPNVDLDAAEGRILFKTVYRNYTGQTKSVRVRIGLDQYNTHAYEQTFDLPASDRPARLAIDATDGRVAQRDDPWWEITDAATSEVLAASVPPTAKIDLEFVYEGGDPLPKDAIKPYALDVPRGKPYAIALPSVPGHEYAGDLERLTVPDPRDGQKIVLPYRELDGKQLTLRLSDPRSGQTLSELKATVFEGETFVPTQNDFIVNNGAGWRAVTATQKLTYDAIVDQVSVVEYEKLPRAEIEFVGRQTYRIGDPHPNGYWDMFKVTRMNGAVSTGGIRYSFRVWNPDPRVLGYEQNYGTID